MRKKVLIAGATVLVMAAISALAASGSSHREAPLISQDPAVGATDVYAFVDPSDPSKVNLIANYYPFQEPAGGPNFYRFADEAIYEINIDNDGNARRDITFRFQFHTEVRNPNTFLYNTGEITSLDDEDWNVRQSYDVTRIRYHDGGSGDAEEIGSDLLTPPSNIGPASTPDYEDLAEQAIHELEDDIKVFAGQRDDPFFVDLGAIFDLLTIRQPPGNEGGGVDGLGGFNVQSIAIQVPIDQITDDEDVIGVWTTSSRPMVRILRRQGERRDRGDFVQVSRLGMPLVNEVVIPLGKKDRFNASRPQDDEQFLDFVTQPELAGLLNALYSGVVNPIPEDGRDDLVAVFLTGIEGLNQPEGVEPAELMRLNTSIGPSEDPERLGVLAGDNAGFPNGRRLADDVVDVELRAVACGYGFDFPPCEDGDNEPNNQLGDGVDKNDVEFLDEFPYLATPHQGFEHEHHPVDPKVALSIGSGMLAGSVLLGAVFALRRRRKAQE